VFNPEKNRILFVSEDGIDFKLYVDGYLINGTKGMIIEAGDGEEVIVTTSLVGCVDNFIKETLPEEEKINLTVNTEHGFSIKEIDKSLNNHILNETIRINSSNGHF